MVKGKVIPVVGGTRQRSGWGAMLQTEGRGFDSHWGRRISSIYPIRPGAVGHGVY
jgi:hypothetical protein